MLKRGENGYFNDIKLKALHFELECVFTHLIIQYYNITIF